MRVSVTLLIFALPFFSAVLAHPKQKHTRSVGIAVPISRRNEIRSASGVVDFKRLKDNIQQRMGTLTAGFSNFEKNTGERHPLAKSKGSSVRSLKRASGAEPLVDESGEGFWYGTIQVGTPCKDFTVLFDTGSTDLILPSKMCDSTCDGHILYDPSASETAVNLNKTFGAAYGNGSNVVNGQIYNDTVSVAGLTARNQTFGAALHYSVGEEKEYFEADGLMGLAYPEIAVLNSSSFFQTLVAEGQATQPKFAFKLSRNESELFLGGVNHKQYQGRFTYVPVTKKGFWQTVISGVFVNDYPLQLHNRVVIVDTGTSLIVGDKDDVVEIYNRIPGSQPADPKYNLPEGIYTIPCNSTAVVSIVIGNKGFPISPSTFNFGFVSEGSETCVGGIRYELGFNAWVLGDVLLQNVYTVFDLGENRIGFAELPGAHFNNL